MKTVTVTKNGKTLTATYTPELAKDFKILYNEDIETKFKRIMESELEKEEDEPMEKLKVMV